MLMVIVMSSTLSCNLQVWVLNLVQLLIHAVFVGGPDDRVGQTTRENTLQTASPSMRVSSPGSPVCYQLSRTRGVVLPPGYWYIHSHAS